MSGVEKSVGDALTAQRVFSLGKVGGARSAVYWTVRMAGCDLTRHKLLRMLDKPDETISHALYQLRTSGLLQRGEETGTWSVSDANPADFKHLAATGTLLLDDIADCGESGVSVAVLARSYGLVAAEVEAALLAALESGAIVRTHIDRAIDGGMGYRVVRAAVAAGADAEAAAQAAGGGVAFDLLDDKRFRTRFDTLQVTLPADVTRAMFRYLDELGGLHLVQRLASGEGAAP